MNRRDLFKTAALGAGVAALGQSEPQHAAHASGGSTATTSGWTPQFFDSHQNETVSTIAELIIPRTDSPGAREAKVNEYIDLYVSDIDPELGAKLIEGLGWLDAHAAAQHQKTFVKLDTAQQVAILQTLQGSKDPALQPGTDLFTQLKELTVTAFYSTKIGVDDLNRGGNIPKAWGCFHG